MNIIDAFMRHDGGVYGMLPDLAALLTFVTVLVMWRALLVADPQAARARAVARHRAEMNSKGKVSRKRVAGVKPVHLMSRILQRVKNLQSERVTQIRDRLLRAGIRANEAVYLYIIIKWGASVICLIVAMIYITMLAHASSISVTNVLIVIVLIVLIFLGPDLYLSNLSSKRRFAIGRGLPDGLDLLVISAEAGLSLDAALYRVSEEMASSAPELAEEFAVTSVELGFLPERKIALHNLAKRVDLAAMRGVVNTLVQTEKYGTPLSHSLRVLSAEFREQRVLQAEEKAARLPTLLTVPMIVFILPSLFIVLIGPAILDVYDNVVK